MNHKLRCITCGKEFNPDTVWYTCPDCGDRKGTLDVEFNYESVNLKRADFDKNANIWQFEKILPVKENSYRTHLHVGGTPLYEFEGLMGLKSVYIKYDGSNPTASYKDRASAMAVTRAKELGVDTICCASTGNAASSISGLAAAAGLKAYIFVPAAAPKAKISQLYVYGANVIAVDGSYDQAFDLSMEVARQKGWYSRNSAINPYLLEGKKTAALEIAVQCDFNVPDYVLVGVGDGTVISSLYKGFYDFHRLGLIDRIPRIIGVQARGSNAVKRAFDKGEPFSPQDMDANTVADSISVGTPRDLYKACNTVLRSEGFYVDVEDEEIIEAIAEMARTTGVFGEPAGSTAYAGLKKLRKMGKIPDHARVAVVVTGNGLKDIRAVEGFVRDEKVAPNMESVLKYIDEKS